MSNLKNIQLSNFTNVYFIGVGGIGMSALARYFLTLKWNVAGFDKTETVLTKTLEEEGVAIHYVDDIHSIPTSFLDKQTTLIVYTPAVSTNHSEFKQFESLGFTILKRSQVLGVLTQHSKGLCVAGTHGKTTTSTLLAHVLNESELKCNAFLGGISSNFNSNLVTSNATENTVIEADEFDRSFLQLSPFATIITSTDADHLDIYGDASVLVEGFQKYVDLIHEDGFLVLKHGLPLTSTVKTITYGIENDLADCSVFNIRFENEKFYFDVRLQDSLWQRVEFGLPGIHNAENALACIIFCLELGLTETEIRHAFITFKGVKRRFEYYIANQDVVYIDDYAHHPTEIKALLDSVKLLYPNRKIAGVFQPHLFSRTKDFMDDFALQLSRIDELLLMPIYPAREEPIPGITSDYLLSKITNEDKGVYDFEEVLKKINETDATLFLTIGAGSIERLTLPISEFLSSKFNHKGEF